MLQFRTFAKKLKETSKIKKQEEKNYTQHLGEPRKLSHGPVI